MKDENIYPIFDRMLSRKDKERCWDNGELCCG